MRMERDETDQFRSGVAAGACDGYSYLSHFFDSVSGFKALGHQLSAISSQPSAPGYHSSPTLITLTDL
jgi:hypothetical protein